VTRTLNATVPWREALHPSEDADVIDLDPALDQQLLDISVRQVVTQVPTHGHMITSGGKRNPAKLDLGAGTQHWR
jgi:hypothetical protein